MCLYCNVEVLVQDSAILSRHCPQKSTCLHARQLYLMIDLLVWLSFSLWMVVFSFKASSSQTRFQFYIKYTPPCLCIIYSNIMFICLNSLHICCFSNTIEIGKFCPPLALGISHELSPSLNSRNNIKLWTFSYCWTDGSLLTWNTKLKMKILSRTLTRSSLGLLRCHILFLNILKITENVYSYKYPVCSMWSPRFTHWTVEWPLARQQSFCHLKPREIVLLCLAQQVSVLCESLLHSGLCSFSISSRAHS